MQERFIPNEGGDFVHRSINSGKDMLGGLTNNIKDDSTRGFTN